MEKRESKGYASLLVILTKKVVNPPPRSLTKGGRIPPIVASSIKEIKKFHIDLVLISKEEEII